MGLYSVFKTTHPREVQSYIHHAVVWDRRRRPRAKLTVMVRETDVDLYVQGAICTYNSLEVNYWSLSLTTHLPDISGIHTLHHFVNHQTILILYCWHFEWIWCRSVGNSNSSAMDGEQVMKWAHCDRYTIVCRAGASTPSPAHAMQRQI